MTPWPRAAAAYPQTLVCDVLSCTSLLNHRLNEMFLIKFVQNLGLSSLFSQQIFAQIKGCLIVEVET